MNRLVLRMRFFHSPGPAQGVLCSEVQRSGLRMTVILLYFGISAQRWRRPSPSQQLERAGLGRWPASWALRSLGGLMRKHAGESLATGIVARRAKTPTAASVATRIEPGPKGSP